MVASQRKLEEPKPLVNPFMKEIMTSEMAYAYMGYAYGLMQVPLDNPSWVWEQMRWDPWFGMAVYRDLEEKDDMLSSCLATRKEALLARRRRVLPASDKLRDKKVAAFVEETLESYFDPVQQGGDHFGFDGALYEMLDAIGKGVSVAEIIWGEASDRIYIQKLKFKPQHLFSFSNWGTLGGYWTASYLLPEDGPLRIRPGIEIEGLPEDGILPQRKFLVRTHQPMLSNRWGTPMDRRAFWLSVFKRGSVKNWLKFLEKGTGSVVAKYRDGAGEGEKSDALSAATMINEEAAGAVSASTEVEVLQHVRATSAAYKEMTNDFCNAGIARLILGQTLTSHGSEGGAGSKALGEVHNEVRLEKVRVDARESEGVINPFLVWPLVLYNFGPNVPPPTWVIDSDPQVDLSAISTWFYKVWQMRIPCSRSYVYNTFQGIEPKDDDDVIDPPAQPQAPEPDSAAGVDSDAVQSNTAFEESVRLRKMRLQRILSGFSGIEDATRAGGHFDLKRAASLFRDLANLAEEEEEPASRGRSQGRGKKKMADVEQSAKEIEDLISGALAEGRRAWRGQMRWIVDGLDEIPDLGALTGKEWQAFFEHETREWDDEIGGVLGDSTLAAYLLGVDQIGWENRAALGGKGVQFAEAQSVFSDKDHLPEEGDSIQFEFDQPPKEAIDYFKRKKIVTRKMFDQLADDARSGSFTVSGVYKKQTIEAFKGAITDALENGTPQKEVLKTFRGIVSGAVKQKELGDFHLENVFRTNTQMAYGVGRRQSLESVADILPWWTYHAVGDDRTRPQHQALSGVCLKSDNSFWASHYPPWAFMCRCTVTADTDPPEGYNAKSPSEGVTIAYDDDGAPAKGEIGTQVVDFNTGGFAGVPAQGGLRGALEEGARRAEQE